MKDVTLIIKGGENIYPAEIENIIYKNPQYKSVRNRIKDKFLKYLLL